MIAETLALATAASFAVGSILVRKGLVRHESMYNAAYTFAAATVIMWLIVLTGNHEMPSGWALLLFSLKGVIEPGIIIFLFFSAYRNLGAAVTVPIFGISAPVTTLLAVIFLKEELTFFIVLGTAIILAGVALLSLRGIKAQIDRKNIMAAVGGSVLAGISVILSKIALNISYTPLSGVAVSFTVGLIVQIIIITALGKFRNLARNLNLSELFLIAGIFNAAAFSFYNLSISEGAVSIVFPLVATQPIFVLFLSWLFLKKHEEITKNVVTGTIMVVAGVALITVFKGV